MRVLVVGGLGFIGSCAARVLAESGHEVHVAGRSDLEAKAPLGFDALVWAAGTRRATLDENRDEHVRAPLATIARVPGLARVVYLSSGEIYGAQPAPFVETAPRLGESTYAHAKIEAEDALQQAGARDGFTVALLRPAVVYGPGQHGPMFVPALVDALVRRERFPMTAGEQTRDFVFVDDVARAIERALAAPPGTYNVGSGVEVTLVDVARAIARRFGPEASRLLDVGALPYRDNEQMRYLLDPTRARTVLGFEPAVSFEAGLDRTVAAARTAAPDARGR